MPAKQMKCVFCGKKFWACRSDAMYCHKRCRQNERRENAKFKPPSLKSGVPGITWDRVIDRWTVKIKIDGKWKYMGSFKDFGKAYLFQLEVLKVA
jgi:hypothetical protein